MRTTWSFIGCFTLMIMTQSCQVLNGIDSLHNTLSTIQENKNATNPESLKVKYDDPSKSDETTKDNDIPEALKKYKRNNDSN